MYAFCWAPYADESTPFAAERKIWEDSKWGQGGHATEEEIEAVGLGGAGTGVKGLMCKHRWRGEFFTSGSPVGSMGRALYDAVASLLETHSYEHFHLVGHSLGAQMSLSCMGFLLALTAQKQNLVLPQRLTLLDPYFSNFSKGYLGGEWVGARARRVVEMARERGVAVEQYKSSMVLNNPFSGTNHKLTLLTAYTVLYPR